MILGFVGTRGQTSIAQHDVLVSWLEENRPTEFHHGCAVGTDFEAMEAVQKLPWKTWVVAHPPLDKKYTNPFAIALSNEICISLSHLERNIAIVDACDVLLVCPKDQDDLLTGTWTMVRYAQRVGKRVVIIMPDGAVSEESPQD